MSKKTNSDKNNKDIRCTVRLNDKEQERLSDLCEKTGKNKSDIFREGLNMVIKNNNI